MEGRSESDHLARIEQAENWLAQTQGELDARTRFMEEARTTQDAAFKELTDAEDEAWNETSPQDLRNSQRLLSTADRLKNVCLDCLNATEEARRARKIRDEAKDTLAAREAEYESGGRG